MKKLLLIALLIVGCEETVAPEPEDCAGVAGGTAELDCFGVCGGVAIKDDWLLGCVDTNLDISDCSSNLILLLSNFSFCINNL